MTTAAQKLLATNEAVNIDKLVKELTQNTAHNDHSSNIVAIARIVKNKRFLTVAQGIEAWRDLNNGLDGVTSAFESSFRKRLYLAAEHAVGKESWKKLYGAM